MWQRLVKIAVVIILGGLAIAGALAFPNAKAAAQGSHSGYTYTQRVCQEYGQQPRWYQVRDEIPGSDGGWAIVLVSSSATRYTFATQTSAGGSSLLPFAIELATPIRRAKTQVTDRNRGLTGFILYHSDGRFAGRVVIDRDNDGDIDVDGDRTFGVSNNLWEFYTYNSTMYGARYIRWANMQWCR